MYVHYFGSDPRGRLYFWKNSGGGVPNFLVLFHFLCDNFKKFPYLSRSQGGEPDPDTSPKGVGSVSPSNNNVCIFIIIYYNINELYVFTKSSEIGK